MEKTLAVFNDCLAMIFYHEEETVTRKKFDIWVMREFGVEESWTKQIVVDPPLGIKRPLGFAKSRELLLVGNDERTTFLYNIVYQEIKNLRLREGPNWFITSQVVVYVESLVSFTGGNVF